MKLLLNVLGVKTGIGGDGQGILSPGEIRGVCSRGQDTVVKLNDKEIVRLAGGNGGKSRLYNKLCKR